MHSVGSHVLVYKLGGASLSVTVMQVNGGIFRVLNSHTDHSIGGESFTEALAQHLATEFKRSVPPENKLSCSAGGYSAAIISLKLAMHTFLK